METLSGDSLHFCKKLSTLLSTTLENNLPALNGLRPTRRLTRRLYNRGPKKDFQRRQGLAQQRPSFRMQYKQRKRRQQLLFTILYDSPRRSQLRIPSRETENHRQSSISLPSTPVNFHIPGSFEPYQESYTCPPRLINFTEAGVDRERSTNHARPSTPKVVRQIAPPDPFVNDNDHNDIANVLLRRRNIPAIHRSISAPPDVHEDFSPYKESRKKSHINSELLKRVYKGLGPRDPDQSRGHLYVMSRLESPGYVKIGVTTDLSARLAQLSSKGLFGTLKLEVDPHDYTFHNYEFAERLVQLELWNERRKSHYRDADKDEHALLVQVNREANSETKNQSGYTEWYQISVEEAHQIVAKWRDWLNNHRPYDSNGKLRGFWKARLDRLTMNSRFLNDGRKSLHSCWSDLLNPSIYYKSYYNFTTACSILCAWCTWIGMHFWSIMTVGFSIVSAAAFLGLSLCYGLNAWGNGVLFAIWAILVMYSLPKEEFTSGDPPDPRTRTRR